MEIKEVNPTFRPFTITFETEEEARDFAFFVRDCSHHSNIDQDIWSNLPMYVQDLVN